MTQSELERHCADLYKRTRELWKAMSCDSGFRTSQLRFRILESPPQLSPELLILSTNPGYDETDTEAEVNSWPDHCLYSSQTQWYIVPKIQRLFQEYASLGSAAALHLLFFKSACLAKTNATESKKRGWKDNSPFVRSRLEKFSRFEARRLILLMRPKAIVTLGMGPFDVLEGKGFSVCVRGNNERLTAVKTFEGTPTFGVIHPSGARVSNDHVLLIRESLRSFLDNPVDYLRSTEDHTQY